MVNFDSKMSIFDSLNIFFALYGISKMILEATEL